MKQLLSTLLVLTLFISCSKDTKTVTDYTAKNEQEIKDYLAKNNLTAQRSTSGLYYIINQVIKGWTEGIPYFKTGGSGVLLISSHLGYGSTNNGPIPGGSVLIFDVKLISVN